MKNLYKSWYFLREYLFPQGCGVCRKRLLSKDEAWYGLCGECRADLTAETGSRCDRCGRPLISEIDRCLPCRENRESPPSCDRIIALFPYMNQYRKLLGAFKFDKSLGVGRFLGECLIGALKTLPLNEGAVLVPVPPRHRKIRDTGWDQINTLAGFLRQGNKEIEVLPCLIRQASLTQKKLDRETRQTNLKGRILAKGKVPKECVLFDDVITTGSTMNACGAALKSAGAEKVFGICLFYD